MNADETKAATCYDCGTPYPWGLDLNLPDQQWKHIFPQDCGLLCPTCICRRAAKLGGSTAILAWIDCIDWEAMRPLEWFEDPQPPAPLPQ